MKRSIFVAGVLLVLAIAGLAIWRGAGPADARLKIGLIIPLSGEAAFAGKGVREGVEMALEDANAQDKISLIYEDGGATPKQGLTAYQKLKNIDGVNIFIGPTGLDQIMSIASILQPDDLVLGFSMCEESFRPYPQIFCTYPGIEPQIASAIPVMKNVAVKNLGLITENDELGDIVRKSLSLHAAEGGYSLTIDERFKRGDKDFRTSILKMKAAKADAVFIAGWPAESQIILRQLHEMRFAGSVFAFMDTTEEDLVGIKDAAEGVFFPGYLPKIIEESFMVRYKARYGKEPDVYVSQAHSIGTTLFQTLRASGFKPDNLAKDMIAKKLKTAIIGYEFKPDRTVSVPLETLVFKNGRMQSVTK